MANRYWVGGTGNWNDTAHWSASSGGAGGASIPTSADSVYFDANSFTGAGQVVTVNVTANCKDMDWTGCTGSPVLYINGQIFTFYGNTTLADMTFQPLSTGYFRAGANATLTTNGITIVCSYFGAASGILSLADDVTFSNTLYLIGGGGLTTNSHNLTGARIQKTDAGTSVVDLGSSTLTLSGGGSSSINYTGTNLSFNANTATFICGGTIVSTNGINFNGATVNLTGATSTITGSNTFYQLNLASGTTQTITFAAGTTQTITNDSNLEGSLGHVHTLTGDGEWYLNYTGTGYLAQDYLNITNSHVTPARTWIAGLNSTDNGGNTGWIFGALSGYLAQTSRAVKSAGVFNAQTLRIVKAASSFNAQAFREVKSLSGYEAQTIRKVTAAAKCKNVRVWYEERVVNLSIQERQTTLSIQKR